MAKKHTSKTGLKVFIIVGIVCAIASAGAHNFDSPFFYEAEDNPDTPTAAADTDSVKLIFPIEDKSQLDPQQGDGQGSTMDLQDPDNIENTIEYNPDDSTYNFRRQVGGQDIQHPTYMDPDDYYRWRAQQDENNYWKQKMNTLDLFSQKPQLPTLYREGLFDRLFGGKGISIKPQGNLDLTFGGNWQNMKNPNLPQRSQKYGIFDFDMQMNVSLLAQIGDKLKMNISNNTKPTFSEQQMRKLEFTGKEDEIIKKIELGNTDFPLRSTLMTGPRSLMGIKAQLQFGRLWVTGVTSIQNSQMKSVTFQNGGQSQSFQVTADSFDENRNFLLGQYFYNNYDKALENLPIINSQVQIDKIQVWVTNRTGATTGIRDVLAFMDLGEYAPHLPVLTDPSGSTLPDNRSNALYNRLQQSPTARTVATATQTMVGIGLTEGQDFQRNTMRQLTTSEFTFQPRLGYVSLNTQINTDDIVAVAYRYTYNGKIYQVGEFAEDIAPDSTNPKIIFLKLVKGVSNRPTLPIWNLMMKNVYYLGASQLSKDNFRLNIFYQDPGGGEKRYLPEGPRAGEPIINLLNLDRLNYQNDPAPDGVFDYVEGITVNSQQGKVIFPVLEPFGDALKPALGGDPQLERRYLYPYLYDSTLTIARQFQQNNRYLIKGTAQSSGGADLYLGGYNIPEGSVVVVAGGSRLTENVDYQVDYSSGRVKILNQGILTSGIPITVQYEDNAAFGYIQQSFTGIRLDYYVNEKLALGGTMMRLTERPYTNKVSYGDDPVKNTQIGLDANYQSEMPGLTRILDKLPIYSSTAPSLVTGSAEVAGIFPGHNKLINIPGDEGGTVFIDDFEGANSSIDLKSGLYNWSLASVPANSKDRFGNTLFPEALYGNDLRYGYNRARLAWYNIEPSLVDGTTSTPESIKADTLFQDYWRMVQYNEVFPNSNRASFQNNISTFDLGYYPEERGPYNFDVSNINPLTGRFTNPDKRWAGIQRAIDNNTDFEAGNVEYITFWMLDPFIYNDTTQGGDLYINLGSVSEDILKDSRLAFENGIPYPKDNSKLDRTDWGFVPKFQQQIVRAFDNDPTARVIQDVGIDGLNDDEEKEQFAQFTAAIQQAITGNQTMLDNLLTDPASDNFRHYRNTEYDNGNAGVLSRYKYFNNPHGNSPVADLNEQFTSSGSAQPDGEDINRDNTLNETESYYQYRVRIERNMQEGTNNIISKRTVAVKLLNGRTQNETWYQFKIPIRGYESVVGGINDLRAIRFMRMFMTGFRDSMVVLRFAQLQLDRNMWRRYQFSLMKPGENIPEEDLLTTSFNVNTVSLQQNANKQPVPYIMPPGIQQQQQIISTGQTQAMDEQSIALQVCGLKDGDSRAIFKDVGRFDLRQYDKLKMFIHAESLPNETPLNDDDLYAFIRIGSDFINNYYEYRIPLSITLPGSATAESVWPESNRMIINTEDLINLKTERNDANRPSYIAYQGQDPSGNTMIVMGNPNLGEVKNIMMGIYNPQKTLATPGDDGQAKCAEVWFDELRATGLNEQPGYAAAGQVNIQLADLGSVRLGGSMHTIGYGNIDQKVNERFRDNFYQYDVSTNLNMGKLLPRTWGVQLPVFAGYTQSVSNPEYDPYDKDIKLSEKISRSSNGDSVRKAAQEYASITSFSLNNVRFTGNPDAKKVKAPMPWSVKNFDLTYTYNRAYKRSPLLESDELVTQHLSLGYTYNIKGLNWEPFKKMIKTNSKWWGLIKDFNINPLPSNFTFRSDLDRAFNETIIRNIDGDGDYQIPPYYFKNFLWSRTYNLRWELTRALNFNYQAANQSRIDEPYGRIDSKEKRDTLWGNLSKLGRNTFFNQTLNATYTLPTKKFPALDWTTATATYGATYNWTAASLLAKSQGNILANTQLKQINGELNFAQLYNKNRWLKAVNTPKAGSNKIGAGIDGAKGVPKGNINMGGKSGTKNENDQGGDKGDGSGKGGAAGSGKGNDSDSKSPKQDPEQKRKASTLPPKPQRKVITENDVKGHDTMSAPQIAEALQKLRKAEKQRFRRDMIAWRNKKKNILPEVSDGERFGGKLATLLKRITFNYSENYGTVLPGYMDSTRFFGINNSSLAPGMFAFGYQPDRVWLDAEAEAGRITTDTIFNGQMQQMYSQTYNLMATLEPVQDMRIDVSFRKDFTKTHNEIFKYDGGEYQHYTPSDFGSFSVSYFSLGTLFSSVDKSTKLSQTFQDFLANRETISRRLGTTNPYTNSVEDPTNPDYYKGYTEYAQDVLIPAFIAAYSGRDPNKVAMIDYGNGNIRSNPFKYYFPMPNWKLTYTGIGRMPSMKEYVTNFVINNAYTCNMSMNSFLTNYYYQDLLGVGFPSFIDSNTNNYIPFFQVPNLTISEQFAPILGIDAAFKNSLTLSVQFNKTRVSSLSLIDYQVSETRSTELIVGGGYRIKGLQLPFTVFGVRQLKNDVNIRVDVGYRSDITTNTYLITEDPQPSRGQKVLSISPTIDYIINDNLQLRLYYDRRQTIPEVSNSYPITTTRAGVMLRFLFTEK